jgi:probable phosphoglycerate mutase
MAKIYLIRHAESQANTAGIFQGQTYDTDLSPLGQKQAASLAARFINEKIDQVFVSPLKRTLQTAQHFNTLTSNNLTIEHALIETNHGAWEGLSKDQVATTWPDLYQLWLTHPSITQFPNGEKFIDTATRAYTWLQPLLDTPGTYTVITHCNIIQALITKILDLDLDSIWNYPLQPTSVTLVQSESPAQVVYWGDASHLKELKSDLAKQAL